MAAGDPAEGAACGGRGQHNAAGRDRAGAGAPAASSAGGASRVYRDRVRLRRAGVHQRRSRTENAAAGDRATAMIGLPAGTRVWLATGATDMRKGFEDRKSTRLNSSHPSISYAAFCLKKKTSLS